MKTGAQVMTERFSAVFCQKIHVFISPKATRQVKSTTRRTLVIVHCESVPLGTTSKHGVLLQLPEQGHKKEMT